MAKGELKSFLYKADGKRQTKEFSLQSWWQKEN
jgi:hypothetical protein